MQRPPARRPPARHGWVASVLAMMVAGFTSGGAVGQSEDRLQERLPKVNPAEVGFAVRHWTVADGLPSQRITSLAQTPDGYLWCGTDDGLVRYDGFRFRVFFADEVPELQGVEIADLSCDRDGRLWIWDGRSKLVALEDGRFRKIGEDHDWRGEWVRPIVTGRSGDCWFISGPDEAFHRFREGRFERFPHPAFPGGREIGERRNPRLNKVWVDETGPRWAMIDSRLRNADGTGRLPERRLVRITSEGIEEVAVEGAGPDFEMQVFFTLPDGSAALGARDGIYVVQDGKWVLRHRFNQPIGKSHGSAVAIRQDAGGNYWIATYSGGLLLSEVDGTTRQFALPEEERRPMIRSLCIDREGSLWVGSRDGLYQIRSRSVRSWGRAEGIPEDEVRAVAEGSDDRIWLANEEAVVPVLPDGSVGTPLFLPRDNLVQHAVIERVAPSADGSLWVALRSFQIETQRWHHRLLRSTEQGFLNVPASVRSITSLHETDDGTLLVGTIGGLFAWDGTTLNPIDLPGLRGKDGVRPVVTAFATDRVGRVVAAVLGAGLFRREAGTWLRLPGPGAGDRQVQNMRSLDIDRAGTIWVGCGRSGLACWMDGSWRSLEGLEKRLPREITGVVADDLGGLWLTSTTGEGLVRFDCAELLGWPNDEAGDPVSTHFGREDGLPSIVAQANYSPVCQDRGGNIWIATKQGAAVLHPDEWRRRRESGKAPQVHIQEVRINDKVVSKFISGSPGQDELCTIVVPPGPRRVVFRYIGIDLAAPEAVRYRYRLEGYEDGWTEAGDRVVAVYPDVPPGHYVFRVVASGRYGLWTELGAGADLTVRALWWERGSTRLLSVLALVTLGSLAYTYRLRQIKTKTRMQEEFSRALIWSQETERKRLARELHDGLGHELLVLKGGIDRELVKRDESAGGTARALSAKAGEVIHQVREISHDLRPPELERFGIGPALESLVLETAELTGVEFAIELDPPDRRLRPVIEISLFRIAQEALSNLARHSDASEGRLALSNTGDTIVLIIEDDGRGFDPAAIERTRGGPGLGLSGMEERAHLLGGTWECKTEPGRGVRMTVTLPLLYRS